MEWVNLNPMILSTFGSLSSPIDDESSSAYQERIQILQDILNKLFHEDRTTRPFRRAIGFTQVIKKDLLPLLVSANDEILGYCVKILINLTVPIECLLPIESLCKTNEGRNTIYELNWLLTSCKEAFLDSKTTRCIIEYIKKYIDRQEVPLTPEACDCINNCLILLRNILHIPEVRGGVVTSHHNQILWNLFTHGFDKIMIELILQHNKYKIWSLSVVQLIALMYRDQHVNTLQKLLNLWFETSPSEEDSSEDNESNTSPPNQMMDEYSFNLTSGPTTSNDSSDISGSEKDKDKEKDDSTPSSPEHETRVKVKTGNQPPQKKSKGFPLRPAPTAMIIESTTEKEEIKKEIVEDTIMSEASSPGRGTSEDIQQVTDDSGISSNNTDVKTNIQFNRNEMSEDCGYGTQHPESISTSSNEEDGVPVHQKPTNLIQKARPVSGKFHLTPQEKKEYRRKKLIKRSHTHTNMKALLHHTPSEEDIAHLLKEFTVDFLLKGYGALVTHLYEILVTELYHSQVDTCHFFWLVSYFMKFVIQLELDIELFSSVISFDILSYLSFEGINMCEHLQIARLHKGCNIDPLVKRLQLIVSAIREVLQTYEIYHKTSTSVHILKFQKKMCRCENLRLMMILLIRQYDPSIQNIQYLQDLIVTNHMMLILLENASSENTDSQFDMIQHLQQFANMEVMHQYGILLENFDDNGEFVNNSIFTMMHHVGGDLSQLPSLFQPNILKSFSKMWETDYDLRDDWSDLIEYTIHQYINIKKPQQAANNLEDSSEWSVDDSKNLYWYYVQNAKSTDPVGAVIKLYIQNGVLNKTRQGVMQQLLIQDVISDGQYKKMMIVENMIEEETSILERTSGSSFGNRRDQITTEADETSVLRDHLIKEKKSSDLIWLQKSLLEACAAKLCIDKKIDCFIEPVPYHSVRIGQSVPLIPFNTEQANAMLYQPFMLLLHKLGLHLPADAGKMYARIPSFLTADMLYTMAEKCGPIDTDNLKFKPSLLEMTKCISPITEEWNSILPSFGPGCSYGHGSLDRVNHSTEWIDIVAKTKNMSTTDDIADTISESTDSDLNRMYVSDEEFGSKSQHYPKESKSM